MSFSLEETDTDQTNPTFWGLQNWFWRGCFIPKIARYVLPPPPLRIPSILRRQSPRAKFWRHLCKRQPKEKGKSSFRNRALVKTSWCSEMPYKIVFFEASTLVSTTALLLKNNYRCEGMRQDFVEHFCEGFRPSISRGNGREKCPQKSLDHISTVH